MKKPAEPTIEDVVEKLERCIFDVTQDDIRALIAAWRKTKKALDDARPFIEFLSHQTEPPGNMAALATKILARIDAAQKGFGPADQKA